MDITLKLIDFVRKVKKNLVIAVLLVSYNVVLSSQTDEPEPPRIRTLSINPETGFVEIRWEPTSSSLVDYYTFKYEAFASKLNPKPSWFPISGYKVNAGNELFISIDPSMLEKIDIDTTPVAFGVIAHYDTLESQVDQLNWDSTLFVKATFDTCLASVNLNWNTYDYNMWAGGNAGYYLYTSINNSPFELTEELNSDVNSYSLTGLIANNNYRICLSALSAENSSDSSLSNVIVLNTDMAAIPSYIHADYATNSGDNAEVHFTIDPQNELNRFNLLRSIKPEGDYQKIKQLVPEENQITYVDNIAFTGGPYYYKLEAENFCNEIIFTSGNSASTIVLLNLGDNTNIQMKWNEYFEWINGVGSYRLERKLGENDFEIIYEGTQTNYSDDEVINMSGTNSSAIVCYKVTATEQDNPENNNAFSISNQICVELPVNIRFEYDAFTPGALNNNSFGPTIDFLPDEFLFKILDRNERVVYKSENPSDCKWDGYINGSLAMQGAYMYVLKYSVRGGKKHIKRGGLVLIYP